ncbi:MAG: bis(5'-nucleosyl)-tetraphosphatase, symmetrical [marine bacterium B5-7]|nr:MAG: bis(5'-nucleosyl)-tetraphosphatase, symmetrical [marine bacterium B5-7]
MALYAIGDIQGCLQPFKSLLKKIDFNLDEDHLVLVGDLVNRGPDSYGTLSTVMSLGDSVSCVLGNHDLNTLAVAAGVREKRPRDTLNTLLQSKHADRMLDWLRCQPLMIQRDGYIFCHAGIFPTWTEREAAARAREVETALQGPEFAVFLNAMFGSLPDRWHDDLTGMERLRFITNVFTRMRYLSADNALDFNETGPPGSQATGLQPWFDCPHLVTSTVVFGHWSSLGYFNNGDVIGLDSGCVWGQCLTAVKLDVSPPVVTRVSC